MTKKKAQNIVQIPESPLPILQQRSLILSPKNSLGGSFKGATIQRVLSPTGSAQRMAEKALQDSMQRNNRRKESKEKYKRPNAAVQHA